MQILETEVVHVGQESVLVKFLGEGGEKIAVTMAVADSQPMIGEEALVRRAKQMMIQCAAFDQLEDLENQERQGLGRPAASDGNGEAVYTFEYREGDSVRRLPRVELPTLEAVRNEALRSAVDLLDEIPDPPGQQGWLVRVRDLHGAVVSSVDFDDAKRQKAAAS